MIASEKAIIEKLNNIDAAKSGSMEDIIQDAQKKADEEPDDDKIEVSRETLEEVNFGSTRRLQRRSAGYQAGQSYSGPGGQRPGERYSYRAL